MSLRTLTSGLIDVERGLRPALQSTMRTKSRDALVRVISKQTSGWIGILYGRYVTGARAQSKEGISEGLDALRKLCSVNSGKFDVLEIDSPMVTQELKQSLGVDLERLLDLAKSKPWCPFPELLTEAETPLSMLKDELIAHHDESETANLPALVEPGEGAFRDGKLVFGGIDDAELAAANQGVLLSDASGETAEAEPDIEWVVFQDLENTLRRARFAGPVSHAVEDEPLATSAGHNLPSAFDAPKMVEPGADDDNARSIYHDSMRKRTDQSPKIFLSVSQKEEQSGGISRARLVKVALGFVVVAISIPLITYGFGQLQDQAAYRLAFEKARSGDKEGARRVYDKLIAATGQAQAYLGRANTWPDGSPEAMADYERAVRLDPTDGVAAARLAGMLFEDRQFERALIVAQLAIAVDASSGETARISGQSLARLGKPREAERYLKQALQLGVSNPGSVAYELSQVTEATGRHAESVKYLDQAIETSPKNQEYLAARARLKLDEGRPDCALSDLDLAMKSGLVPAEVHYLRARCLQSKNKGEEALSEYTAAVDGGYDRPEALRALGLLALDQGKYGLAVQALDKVVAASPGDKRAAAAKQEAARKLQAQAPVRRIGETGGAPVALVARGDELKRGYAALKGGDVGTACELLTLAVKSNPNLPQARRYLAHALYRAGDYSGAAKQYMSLSELEQLSAEDTVAFGKVLTKAGSYERAISVLHPLVEANPQYTEGRVALVKAYILAGFNDHARKQCMEGMENSPGSKDYQTFRSLMP